MVTMLSELKYKAVLKHWSRDRPLCNCQNAYAHACLRSGCSAAQIDARNEVGEHTFDLLDDLAQALNLPRPTL